MGISLEEMSRRLQKLEEAYDYQRKQCAEAFERNSERMGMGAKKMAEHDLKIKHLCQWKDSVADDLRAIRGEQGASKNYMIGILISLVVASIMLALNLLVS